DRRAAGKAVRRIHPSRCLDRAALRRHRAWARHHAQARAHDGRRRDRDERAEQGLGVHGPSAWRRAHISVMNLPRRRLLHLAASAAVLASLPRNARAQTYPTRPITMIVPFPAGGPTDTIGRIVAEGMR